MVVAEDEAAAVNEEDDEEDATTVWAVNDSPDIPSVIISLLSFPCS